MSDIMVELRAANPAPAEAEPHPAAMSDTALLAEIDTRSGTDMSLDEKTNTTQVVPTKPSRRAKAALVAAGAFVVVLGAVGLAAVIGDEPAPTTVPPADETTAPPPSTTVTTTTSPPPTTAVVPTVPPETLADLNAFVAAFNSGDSATYEAMFVPGMERENHGPASVWPTAVPELVNLYRYRLALGTSIAIEACEGSTSDLVWCEVQGANELTRAAGVDNTSRQGFRFEEGRLAEWRFLTPSMNSPYIRAVQDIIDYHARAYPNEPSIGGFVTAEFTATVETAERVVELIPEWIASREAG